MTIATAELYAYLVTQTKIIQTDMDTHTATPMETYTAIEKLEWTTATSILL